MGRGHLSDEEKGALRKNPFVVDVVENRIVYSNEFKHRFMSEYNKGKKPTRIFKDAGFDPKMLGSKRIERASARWRESYEAGSLGKYDDGSVRHKKIEVQQAQEAKMRKAQENKKVVKK